MVNGLHFYSAFIQSALQCMPLIQPFTHTFTHQCRLTAMQGTNQLIRSNWGLGVLLRDTSIRPGWDRTGNPLTARRQLLPPKPNIFPDSLNLFTILWTVDGERPKFAILLWEKMFLNWLTILTQSLAQSLWWMLLLYSILPVKLLILETFQNNVFSLVLPLSQLLWVCCRHHLLFFYIYKIQLGLSVKTWTLFSLYFYQLNKCSSDLTNTLFVLIAFFESVQTFIEMEFVNIEIIIYIFALLSPSCQLRPVGPSPLTFLINNVFHRHVLHKNKICLYSLQLKLHSIQECSFYLGIQLMCIWPNKCLASTI